MRLFELTVNSPDWRRYQVEGEHAWSMPPLACDTCGSCWKTTGEAYPTVDVSEIAEANLEANQRPLGNGAFEQLRHRLRTLVPEGAPLKPSAAFGSFTGTGREAFYDFVWNESWTMFVQSDVLVQLREKGVRMPKCGAPELSPKGNSPVALPALFEPEAVPLVDFAATSLREPRRSACPRCGRQPGSFAKFIVDRSNGIPDDIDLFRARNNTAIYIATERLINAVQELELTGCEFNALAVE